MLSYLGLTSETVCRILAQLERQGVLVVKFRTIDVLDLAALNGGARFNAGGNAPGSGLVAAGPTTAEHAGC